MYIRLIILVEPKNSLSAHLILNKYFFLSKKMHQLCRPNIGFSFIHFNHPLCQDASGAKIVSTWQIYTDFQPITSPVHHTDFASHTSPMGCFKFVDLNANTLNWGITIPKHCKCMDYHTIWFSSSTLYRRGHFFIVVKNGIFG